jgi:transcription initiation factor TFIIB
MSTSNISYEMKKIRKWTEWQSMPHKEKALYDEFQFITIMAQNHGIPKIFIDNAMSIHKDISEQKMFRGMNRDGIKAASIYISCRLNDCPRTSHEIAEIFNIDKASATAGCSMAVNILNNIERHSETQTELCKITPSLMVERFCCYFDMDEDWVLLAKFMAHKIEELGLIRDNTPQAVASGIVYYIGQRVGLPISKTDIIQKCQISDVTVAKCYKKMVLFESQIVPPSVLAKI